MNPIPVTEQIVSLERVFYFCNVATTYIYFFFIIDKLKPDRLNKNSILTKIFEISFFKSNF